MQIDFTTGSIGKKIFLFTLPLMAGMYSSSCTMWWIRSLWAGMPGWRFWQR